MTASSGEGIGRNSNMLKLQELGGLEIVSNGYLFKIPLDPTCRKSSEQRSRNNSEKSQARSRRITRVTTPVLPQEKLTKSRWQGLRDTSLLPRGHGGGYICIYIYICIYVWVMDVLHTRHMMLYNIYHVLHTICDIQYVMSYIMLNHVRVYYIHM